MQHVTPPERGRCFIFAKHQTEYRALPAILMPDGTVISRWHCSWLDRLRLLWFGDLWLSVLTLNEPLQPIKVDTVCPLRRVD
jgi:hypothetical protein